METTAVEKVERVESAVVHSTDQRPVELVGGISLLPVEQQNVVLTEYKARRDNFRRWLLSQLREGIHYGFPPGCECRYDADGNLLQWNQKKGSYVPISAKQWTAKPSLYKAGALFLIELLRLKDSYKSDMDAWKMMGGQTGVIVRTCSIINPVSGDILGEGTGAFKVGGKGMDENAAVKMADKRAAVAAVINTIAVCGDLFTQDLEDKQRTGKPSAAPVVPPEQEQDFAVMVQEWIDAVVEKANPIHGRKVTPGELKALRAHLKVWCQGDIPQTADAAIAWLRIHAVPAAMENNKGEVIGIKFVEVQGKEEPDGDGATE